MISLGTGKASEYQQALFFLGNAETGRLGQSEKNDLFASDGADVVMHAYHFASVIGWAQAVTRTIKPHALQQRPCISRFESYNEQVSGVLLYG
jgi:hypothetical protein